MSGRSRKRMTRKSTETSAPKRSFEQLVTELHSISGASKSPFRFKRAALLDLQKSVESAFDEFFGDAAMCALHAGRVSVMGKDIKFALRIGAWKKYHKQKPQRKYSSIQRKRIDQALRRWISKPAIRRMIMAHSSEVKRINEDAYDAAYEILPMYILGDLDISGVITHSS